MKILIVEDDIKISNFLVKGLQEEGYVTDNTYDGNEALYLLDEFTYDLILLDVMIPSINGFDLCKIIRDKKIETPIIMLTAKSSIEDKVLGLNEGANDYLTKPFSFEELLARMRVQLRTQSKNTTNNLQIADLVLELDNKKVFRAGKEIILTKKEFMLLEFLMLNKGKLVTDKMISEALWDMDSNAISNIINVYIYKLRNKIDKEFEKKLLQTQRGMGYKLVD
jgi:DNA-binding response OmpR family regulator